VLVGSEDSAAEEASWEEVAAAFPVLEALGKTSSVDEG
jgi:hypothetical protein